MVWKKIVAATAAVIGLASAAAAPAQAQDLRSLIESPNVTTCSSEFLIAIPGGGGTTSFMPEKMPIGAMVKEIALDTYRQSRGSIQPVWIGYNSTPFTLSTYTDSSRSGYRETSATMRRLARMCPKAQFSIVGYSEGADIGAKLVNNMGKGRGPLPAHKINSAVFVSNPHLADNGGAFAGGATKETRGALERLDGGYGELSDRVLDVCRTDDPICALPHEWRVHVDPMLRMATLRGRVPVSGFATIVAKRSPTTIPLLLSVRNHGMYGPRLLGPAAGWILERHAPVRPAQPKPSEEARPTQER